MTAPGAGEEERAQPTSPGERPVVVVGVDGSAASRAALAFAAEEARLRGGTLRVVHGWWISSVSYLGYVPPSAFEGIGEAALAMVEQEVAEVLGPHPDLEVTLDVREGRAARVVTEAAKGATLLVVGARGRGGFAGLLLGSVSQQVVAHAPCPVTVVHDHRGAEGRRGAEEPSAPQ